MQNSQNLLSHDEVRNKRQSLKGEKNSTELIKVFHKQLSELLWSEKKFADLIPRLISNATNEVLIEVLTDQMQEVIVHIGRLATMFRLTKQKTAAAKYDEMATLIIEAEKISEKDDAKVDCDVEIILVLKKIEHRMFTAYRKLRELTEALELSDCENLILDTLSEKKATSLKLVKVATLQHP